MLLIHMPCSRVRSRKAVDVYVPKPLAAQSAPACLAEHLYGMEFCCQISLALLEL
jgi:hypothetical protein